MVSQLPCKRRSGHPRLHVPVKVLQVHVFRDGLEVHGQAQFLTQRHGECALARAYQAGYADERVGEGGRAS